jgi:hypothetical protein
MVGDGPGGEFFHWKKNLDLPDPEDVLKNPDAVPIPDSGDKQFALLSGVTSAVINNLTRERWNAAWRLIERFVDATLADVTFVFAKALVGAASNKNLTIPTELGVKLYSVFNAAGLINLINQNK